MTGQTNLGEMLNRLSPILLDEVYVFCTLPDADYGAMAHLSPLCCFREKEGLTLILAREKAEAAGLPCQTVFRCITLGVHSGLSAVGLTAAVSTALASEGISANMVAAYFHDHVFVPGNKADAAMAVLNQFKC